MLERRVFAFQTLRPFLASRAATDCRIVPSLSLVAVSMMNVLPGTAAEFEGRELCATSYQPPHDIVILDLFNSLGEGWFAVL